MDGAQEHELEEWTTGRTTQPRALGNFDIIDQATGLLDPPPPYQSGPRQNEGNQNVASETSHPAPVETIALIRVRPTSNWSCGRIICYVISFLIVAMVSFFTCAIVLNADSMADPASESTLFPEVFRRSDLQPSTTMFPAVSGLYIIPASTTKADWLRANRARVEPGMSTTSSLKDIAWNSKGIEERTPIAISNGWREPELIASDKGVTFNRWGVEILYRLHRRAVSVVQSERGWCMDNSCSKGKVLSVMCRKNRENKDRSEQQECDWCRDEKQRAEKTLMQKDEIAKHCTTVSHQAADLLSVVCGLLLISALATSAILSFRLWSRKKARTDRKIALSEPHKSNRYGSLWSFRSVSNLVKPSGRARSSEQESLRDQSVFSKSSESLGTNAEGIRIRTRQQEKDEYPSPLDGLHPFNENAKIPIMPPATKLRVSSNLDNMGQEVPGLGNPNGQLRRRRSSSGSEAVSSGSEHIPRTEKISMTRRSFVGEHGPSEAGTNTTSTTRSVEHHGQSVLGR